MTKRPETASVVGRIILFIFRHKSMKKSNSSNLAPCLGTTVMGERGQVVIPKEVRDAAGLKSGDKFIVFAPHDHAMVLIPMNKAQEIIKVLKRRMSFLEKSL